MTATRRGRIAQWRDKFIVEERYLQPAARRRLYVTSGILVATGAVAFAFLLVSVVTQTGFHELDATVEAWFNERVDGTATGIMIVLAVAFGPVALPIIILVVLVIWISVARHLWRPLLLAGGMISGVVLAQTIAPLVQHPRPPVGLMLFGPDHSFSFPSGHVLGTSDFLLITAYLLASRIQRTWFTIAAFSVAIASIGMQIVSRLYLGYHWISDTTASIALSLVIVGTVIAIDTHRTVRVPGEPILGPLSQLQRDGT
ncbi:phosphatase PAP2 family protein [Herbiconiux sp. CPCC 203407]|uniref:Phosphatase PAP2 family protein n=1 Tax=Herbiconiux oxytropis TaxID=2970915 RepID=A0AA42BVJ8_9MICO|nr:phosphatase PAP2 family protein [Herbiconiux oxytropis]MCS5721815.1 phosphatase PAP2 family protein [Herbiconiux oxytropis]MCS5727341.1 phosphatase PAP2 family protein [Herbiconiux oxytropis]